jgi:hypothetical protein
LSAERSNSELVHGQRRGHSAKLDGDVVWHGRPEEVARLVASVRAHCTCPRGARPGQVTAGCGAHQILADQHILDGLASARAVVNRTLDEEWQAPSAAGARGAFVMSLLALLLLLSVGGLTHPSDTPVDHAVASWQTR